MSAPRSFRTTRTIFALMLREMTTTYGRSVGGFMWAFIEPIFGIAFLSLVFSFAFRSPSLGTNFPIFYATGMLPFLMYQDIALKVARSLMFSKQLLFYPAVTYLDTIFARFLLNLMVHIVVFYVLVVGIRWAFDIHTTLRFEPIVLSVVLAALFGLGMGCVNCFVFSLFPVWERIWTIITRPLFILSGVIFLIDNVPEPYQSILWFNPLVHIIGLMRKGFYPSYDASYVSVTYVALVSLALINFGLLLLNRYNKDITNF